MLNGITADDRKQCAGVRCVKAQVDRQSIGEHNDGKIENALEMSHEDNIFARQDPAHIQIRADHSDKQDSRTNQPDCKVLSSGKPNQKASLIRNTATIRMISLYSSMSHTPHIFHQVSGKRLSVGHCNGETDI